jgi:hypothetical protein
MDRVHGPGSWVHGIGTHIGSSNPRSTIRILCSERLSTHLISAVRARSDGGAVGFGRLAARAHAHGGGSIGACPRGVGAALRGGDLIAEWPKVDRGRRGLSPVAGRRGQQLLDGLRWQLPSSKHSRWRAAVLELLRPRHRARQLQGLPQYSLD